MSQKSIVGTWRLISFHGRNTNGDLRPALGENPQGLLVYTAQGYMIAILSEAGRTPVSLGRFSRWDSRRSACCG